MILDLYFLSTLAQVCRAFLSFSHHALKEASQGWANIIDYRFSHYTQEARMAFVRKKTVNGKEYAQVVENYRERGKVRQRVLLHLGEFTPAKATIYWPKFAQNKRNRNWQRWEAKAKTLRELVEQGKLAISDEDTRQVEEERAAKLKALEGLEARLSS